MLARTGRAGSPLGRCAVLAALALLFVSGDALGQSLSASSIKAAAGITTAAARRHVYALASDAMLGRDTPSPELDSAAKYIAAQFREYGLEPVAGQSFHTYHLTRHERGAGNTFSVNGKVFALDSDFVPFTFADTGRVAGDVVFAGYGISQPDSGYDDYAGLDVRGRIVVVTGSKPIRYKGRTPRDAQKMRTAKAHGAAAIVFMADPRYATGDGPPVANAVPPPGEASRSAAGIWQFNPRIEPPRAIPAVGVSVRTGTEMFGVQWDSIAARLNRIDSTTQPASGALPCVIALEVRAEPRRVPVRNVVGMIRGSSRPEEYVVIGAHYDHIGHHAKPNAIDDADTIYNGADDNASGTTALMLAAQSFGRLEPRARPARSLIFIAFSGEEKGLFGSRAWVADPLVPNAAVKAMINMDMVGRNHRDSVLAGGKSVSPDMCRLLEKANRAEPMKIGYTIEGFLFRSDQASFAEKDIPILFLSGGLHHDYHQPSDSPDKIDFVKVARIARLCFRTAWLAADAPTPPAFLPRKQESPLPRD